MFETYRISDDVEAGRLTEGPFADFYRYLNSSSGLTWLRGVTGDERIAYVDAQATRYRAGHFLAAHTDAAEGKHRLYAYVLNLTPAWNTDWGGLLQFHSNDAHIAEAYAPRWNALNLFRVPQPHAVSYVPPFVEANRLSITGWLRAERPPGR